MFSNNADLVEPNIKKEVEDRLWIEKRIDEHIRDLYTSFMKGFYERLSDNLKTQTNKNNER